MENELSIYEVLSNVNVESFVRGKNGFRYLSWSDAVANLLEKCPTATWEHREWDGVPYLHTKGGCFVEVSVEIGGIKRSQLHPILDFRNQPVKEPNAFQINSSLQRALAKAISLHGLGLYIYRGEDLPPSEKEALIEVREELVTLTKQRGTYSAALQSKIDKMNYDDLRAKIDELRKED